MESPSPLERLRRELALAVGENAVFDGWSQKAVDSAAAQLGLDPVQARLAMPKTQAAMIDVYILEVDRALEAYFTPKRLAAMKIREKIRALIWQRLEIMGPAREAVRRALAILAMPQNLPLAGAGDVGPGARSRPRRAAEPCHAAEPAARVAHFMAQRRPHVADRRR